MWNEFCYNLESFNPVFTAVLLKARGRSDAPTPRRHCTPPGPHPSPPWFPPPLPQVQSTIGLSDYKCRDAALQHLIVPLAGEYGLAAEYKLGKTHRQLFSEFYTSVTGKSLDSLLDENIRRAEQPRGDCPFCRPSPPRSFVAPPLHHSLCCCCFSRRTPPPQSTPPPSPAAGPSTPRSSSRA